MRQRNRSVASNNVRFSLPSVVLSIVLLITLSTSSIASSTEMSSLYSCLSSDVAVPLFAPMQVAFHPEKFPDGSEWYSWNS